MRVLLMELHQESNSFSPVNSVLEDYQRCSILEGERFIEGIRGKKIALTGMLDALEEAGIDAIPGYAMRAPAGGIVEHEVVEHFIDKFTAIVKSTPDLDGCFISFHGATQSTRSQDVCGDILREARGMLGDKVVISTSYDLHANITGQIARHADFICGYRTYPHMDVYETGYRAARLGIRKLNGEGGLNMACVWVPMIQPASGYTTQSGALGGLMDALRRKEKEGALIDFSVFQMQPWLDVSCGGSAVVTIASSARDAARLARRTARELWSIRDRMQPELCSFEQIVTLAGACPDGRPLVAVDFSDSANAGAAGDNFSIAQYVMERGNGLRTAAMVNDEAVVARAFEAGVGATLRTAIGGRRDSARSSAVPVTALVRSLHDGSFLLEGPSMRKVGCNVGRTAVLSVGNMDVVVYSSMACTGDPQLFRHFGVEPTLYRIVIVKANTSFRAAYEKFAGQICLVDTGCAATSRLRDLPFKRLPAHFYPFSDEAFPKQLDEAFVK